jgi:hypothetical protein
MHELWAGGEECFELDHFHPRAYYSHLLNDFYNLYYSCHVCNKLKWYHPTPAESAAGKQIVDLCKDNFTTHFQELPNGKWKPLTAAARYTLIQLRLNRDHLVKLRLELAKRT